MLDMPTWRFLRSISPRRWPGPSVYCDPRLRAGHGGRGGRYPSFFLAEAFACWRPWVSVCALVFFAQWKQDALEAVPGRTSACLLGLIGVSFSSLGLRRGGYQLATWAGQITTPTQAGWHWLNHWPARDSCASALLVLPQLLLGAGKRHGTDACLCGPC